MTTKRVGFTGTRKGLSREQRRTLKNLLLLHCPDEFHHGDCIGADADAHDLVRAILPQCRVIIHPPVAETWRAHKFGHRELAAHDYLQRNHDIVDACDILIACPAQLKEQWRGSGTWSTIRYARGRKPMHIISPSGEGITTFPIRSKS